MVKQEGILTSRGVRVLKCWVFWNPNSTWVLKLKWRTWVRLQTIVTDFICVPVFYIDPSLNLLSKLHIDIMCNNSDFGNGSEKITTPTPLLLTSDQIIIPNVYLHALKIIGWLLVLSQIIAYLVSLNFNWFIFKGSRRDQISIGDVYSVSGILK